jgi:hypothetical protein
MTRIIIFAQLLVKNKERNKSKKNCRPLLAVFTVRIFFMASLVFSPADSNNVEKPFFKGKLFDVTFHDSKLEEEDSLLLERLNNVPTKYQLNRDKILSLEAVDVGKIIGALYRDIEKNGDTKIPPSCEDHDMFDRVINPNIRLLNKLLSEHPYLTPSGENIFPLQELHSSLKDILKLLKSLVELVKIIAENMGLLCEVGAFLLKLIASTLLVLLAIVRFVLYDIWLFLFLPCCQKHSELVREVTTVLESIWV